MKIIVMEVKTEDLRRVINNILLIREEPENHPKEIPFLEPIVEKNPEYDFIEPGPPVKQGHKRGRPKKKELSATAEALKEIEEETVEEEEI